MNPKKLFGRVTYESQLEDMLTSAERELEQSRMMQLRARDDLHAADASVAFAEQRVARLQQAAEVETFSKTLEALT